MSNRKRLLPIAIVVVAGACLSTAHAQDWSRIQESMDRARAQPAPGTVVTKLYPGDVPVYGLGEDTFVSVGAYAFQGAESGDHLKDDGNGYRYLETLDSGYLAAAVNLPGGSAIDALSLDACAGETGTLTIGLYDASFGGLPVALIHSLTASGACALTTHVFPKFEYASIRQNPLYLVIHWEGPTDGSLKFNAASVGYRRLVSPAPATATFNDVASGHPFFQFIEALAASGVTGGCGGGSFCPDAPLTRGQMAVFLSKALGLHWSD